jgi:hypothetical protein
MVVRIPLTQGKEAIIDEADYPLVSQYRWHAVNHPHTWYVVSHGPGGRTMYMHRLIMGFPPNVDHKDGDGLNNSRSNLRACTGTQNQCNRKGLQRNNTVGYVGVEYAPKRNKPYRARVHFRGRHHFAGWHATKEEAAAARDRLAKELHGEFVTLNESVARP